ncbi:hypothetical protein [Agreia bicolorata]|nr:hypothetical protein [Agreia bicolorata]
MEEGMLGITPEQQKLLDSVLEFADLDLDKTAFQSSTEAGVFVETLCGYVKCIMDPVALEQSLRRVQGPDTDNPWRTMREFLELKSIHLDEAVATQRGPVLVMEANGAFYRPPSNG